MVSNFESAAVEEVTGMGFSVEWAEHALSQSSGDPAAALDFIFDHTDEMDDLIAAVPRSGTPTGPPVGEVAAIIADDSSGSMHVSNYSGTASHAAVVLGIAVSDEPVLAFVGEYELLPRPPPPPGMALPSVPHSPPPPPLAREERARAWACAQCTFEFGNDGALTCPVCLALRHGPVRVLKRTLQKSMPPAGSKLLMPLRPLRKLLLTLLTLLRWPRSCPWSTLASGCAKRARL
jgi:hypothetical protein